MQLSNLRKPLAAAALALACSFPTMAPAAELLVCIRDGIAGPSDPLECENAESVKSKGMSMASLYKDGWRLVSVNIASKTMGMVTVLFFDKD